MGLFSKLKSNVTGGVKVRVEAPSSSPSNQVIPVNITITSDTTQTISSVKAQVRAEMREENATFGNGQGVGVQNERSMAQTVAEAESRETFVINPGETKTVSLQLYMNGSGVGANMFPQMPNGGGTLGNVLGAVANVAQNFERVNFIYSVHGSVDVQGHNLSPSDKQPIQILPASENAPAVQQQQVENLQPQAPAMPPQQPAAIAGEQQPTQPLAVPPQNQNPGQPQ